MCGLIVFAFMLYDLLHCRITYQYFIILGAKENKKNVLCKKNTLVNKRKAPPLTRCQCTFIQPPYLFFVVFPEVTEILLDC